MSASQRIPGGYPNQADTVDSGPGPAIVSDGFWTVTQTADRTGHMNRPCPPSSVILPTDDDFASKSANKHWEHQNTWDRMGTSTEEQDIAQAVEMSLKEQKDAQARNAEGQKAKASSWAAEARDPDEYVATDGPTQETATKKNPRNTIKDMVDNIALRLSNEFTPIVDERGDTLVYIGPPSRTRYQSYNEYAHIKKHFDRFHRIDSRRLKTLNSTKFDKLLSPKACIFAEKRLKKLDAYRIVSQEVKNATKYHIDLRPPSEDEEAVILLTELSCSQGIRTWHLAQDKYDIQSTAILGNDSLDTEANPYYIDPLMLQMGNTGDSLPEARAIVSDPGGVPDYSALRHHSAVERLLNTIYGDDPKLDSAPKMWTFFAVAQYFDCAQHPTISKWISAWLIRAGNRNFIQNNPEVAYRIGMGIMDAALTKDAYSILVGEKALIDICSEVNGIILPRSVSVHGRKQDNLDDDERSRISHAASSLVHRVTAIFRSVMVDLEWIYTSKEYQRLLDIKVTSPAEEEIVKEAKDHLHGFVKGRFLRIVRMGLASAFSELDLTSDNTAPFRHGCRLDFAITYTQLHQEARPFTRSFWIVLSRARFQDGICNTHVTHVGELKEVADGTSNQGIKIITRAALDMAIMDVNKLIVRREANLMSNTSIPSVGKQQSRGTVRGILGLNQETPTGASREPPHETPKRGSNDFDVSVTSTSKRRKTMDRDAETFTLPYRLHNPFTRRSPSSGSDYEAIRENGRLLSSADAPNRVEHSLRSEERSELVEEGTFDADMFTMDDTTNQEVSPESRPSAIHYAPLPPPAVGRPMHRRSSDNLVSATTKSPINPEQRSAYVRNVDAESGLPVFKLKPVDDVPPVAPQVGLRDWTTPNLKALPSWGATDWYFDQETRTWRQDRPCASEPQLPKENSDSQWQDPTPTPARQISARRPVQQFSNTNTPREDNTLVLRLPTVPTVAPERSYVKKKKDEPSVADDPWLRSSYYPINPNKILEEFSAALTKQCDEIIHPAHLFHGSERLPVDLVDHLLNIDENEIKFLPLWAGGYDDGTGGVFEDSVPNLEAGGFKGGKRGISNVDGIGGEGSLSGSESSFDDIASDAVSTVGKASKAATDGTHTVKSLSENGDTDSESGFMNQDDVYEAIQELRMEEIRKGKMKAVDEDDDGDISTIMGAGSDIQGDFFGANDDDEDISSPFDQDEDDDEKISVKGKDKANDDNDDDMDDMEIIDKNDL